MLRVLLAAIMCRFRTMRSACAVLKLDHLCVVCHGSEPPWPLAEGITAFPAGNLCSASNVP